MNNASVSMTGRQALSIIKSSLLRFHNVTTREKALKALDNSRSGSHPVEVIMRVTLEEYVALGCPIFPNDAKLEEVALKIFESLEAKLSPPP